MDNFDAHDIVARLREKSQGEAAAVEYDRAESAKKSERAMAVLRCFGVPRRARDTLIGGTVVTRSLEAVREWSALGEEAWCLVLSAPVGTGKSTASAWWLREVTRGSDLAPDPRLVKRWWPAPEICAIDSFGAEFRSLSECEALVLDDVGAEYSDQRGALQSKLDRIIDARYREYRRTIITTNLSANDFRERYGERLFDRLREGGRWESIKAQSMRRGA